MERRNIEILKSPEVFNELKESGIEVLFQEQIQKLTNDDFENSGIDPEDGPRSLFIFKVEANHPSILNSDRNHPEGLPFYVDACQPMNDYAEFFWSAMVEPIQTEVESIKKYCEETVNFC